MNTKQKIQLGLGALLILGGAAIAVVIPVGGLAIAGVLIPSGIAVAGFSNTVLNAVGNSLGASKGVQVEPSATDKIPKVN